MEHIGRGVFFRRLLLSSECVLFGCLGENVMMMAITMMKCARCCECECMKCMHRNVSFILWNSAVCSRARSRANAIVKPTRYLDRSLFDWNQNRTQCCCCSVLFLRFVSIFTAFSNNKSTNGKCYWIVETYSVARSLNIILTETSMFSGRFFSSLGRFAFFYFNGPCLSTRFDAIRRFCSKFSITRISYLFLFFPTCVTNGIRCLTVARSSQTMPCQSMRTHYFLSFARSRA